MGIPSKRAHIRCVGLTWRASEFSFLPSAFYGANVLDESPFIVMEYLKNGNSLEYIDRNPGCNRLRMVRMSCLIIGIVVDP